MNTQEGARAESGDYLARLAQAFVGSIPQDLPPDGLFEPGSAVWRVTTSSSPVTVVRSLLLQALHPLAMAGVVQHSNWKQDMIGRAAATAQYVDVVTFGSAADAEKVAARVRKVHEYVRGTDPITGQTYAAPDPHLLLWVHVAMVDSYIAVDRTFGSQLEDVDYDRYCGEMVKFAELVGAPAPMVPATTAALQASIDTYRPELRYSEIVRDSIGSLLDPPGLDEETRGFWRDIGEAAFATMPTWAADLYGHQQAAITPEYRRSVLQVLGVLDFAFELQPGVVEARERIKRWMKVTA